MRKDLFTYSMLCGTGLLLACASPPLAPTLTVKPVQAVSGVNDRADGYYQLGRYYQGQNRLDQAIDAYRKALAADASFADAHNALGTIYAIQGRLDMAIIEFRTVVEALPAASYALSNLGYVYILQGRTDEAIALLDRATELDQTNQRAWNNLGTALAQRGDLAAANEKFARADGLAAAAAMATGAASTASAPVVAAAESATASPVTAIAVSPAVAPAETPVGAAIVDNTGAGEVVQLAPNVFELRLAAVPPAIAAPAPSAQHFRLELSNGNGVTGMARRLGEQLAAIGLPKARLTNQKPFDQRVTEIQYRNGYADEAWSLRRRMPNQPVMIPTDGLRARTDVRVVLGKDLPFDVALRDAAPEVTRLASAAQDAASRNK